MHRGKDCQMFWHTATIVSNILNCHIDPKKRPRGVSPAECHPYFAQHWRAGLTVTKDTIDAFVAMCGVTPERARRSEAQALARKAAADEIAARMRQRMVAPCKQLTLN